MVFITMSFNYKTLINHYLDQVTFRTHYYKMSRSTEYHKYCQTEFEMADRILAWSIRIVPSLSCPAHFLGFKVSLILNVGAISRAKLLMIFYYCRKMEDVSNQSLVWYFTHKT